MTDDKQLSLYYRWLDFRDFQLFKLRQFIAATPCHILSHKWVGEEVGLAFGSKNMIGGAFARCQRCNGLKYLRPLTKEEDNNFKDHRGILYISGNIYVNPETTTEASIQ